ncbi:hypothetical protein N7537_007582 [Penicillium hordei]|uniref:Uncharacterized protein n=1 Tax=Penicillium hordei TaxID=40994 RepID=A0AAD6H0T0_9EURO|nr:uncharacterized protein N7537_007582 [Penicillium hordei]KAJ5597498.1 hypothetical protein N7537_007582 [Penicillium hordei]
MSSNVAGTGADPQPKKRFSVRPIHGNWRQSIKRLKRILADLRAGMHFGLSPARPDSSTRKEPEDSKRSEDNEPHEAPAASFTEQTPKREDESSPAKHPNRDPSQVRSGSRTTTAGKKYYKYLRVPSNSPDRGSVETTLKGKTRVDVIPDESFKRPFIGQKPEASWKDLYGGLLLAEKDFNRITMSRMHAEFMMRRFRCRTMRPRNCEPATSLSEFFDLQMYLRDECNAPKPGYSGSGTEEGSS